MDFLEKVARRNRRRSCNCTAIGQPGESIEKENSNLLTRADEENLNFTQRQRESKREVEIDVMIINCRSAA